MREIKFRAYCNLDKTWHYWTVYDGYPSGVYGGLSDPQQYTGFKDKNGNDIYEGDLIRALKSYMYPKVIAEIAWDNGWYADNKKLLVHWRMSIGFTSSVEIVGNIFK